MRVPPYPSDGAMTTYARVLSFPALTMALALLLPIASAQAPRSGIRIEFTAIDTQGGMSGRAFLPMSSRDVLTGARAPALPACPGAFRVRATARQTRGAVRQITLTLVTQTPGTLPIDDTACPGAFVATTLEDGTVLSGGRGEVVVSSIVLPGDVSGAITGRFSQTAIRYGTPVTIRGEFRIPFSPPSPPSPRAPTGS